MPERVYQGPALDATGQHITESPAWGDTDEDDGDELDEFGQSGPVATDGGEPDDD